MPLGTTLYGALYGTPNGLLAIGLVLTYRISRTVAEIVRIGYSYHVDSTS